LAFFKVIAASLISKLVEFDQFKIWVIQFLPQTKEFYGTSAAKPIFNHIGGSVVVPVFSNVC
jgi:hypothetical protein